MFSGGDYEEVGRWLANFVAAHAKRENARVEAVADTAGARQGKSYGVRVRLGKRLMPPPDQSPLELSFGEVADGRGQLAWCNELAARVRGLAAAFAAANQPSRQRA